MCPTSSLARKDTEWAVGMAVWKTFWNELQKYRFWLWLTSSLSHKKDFFFLSRYKEISKHVLPDHPGIFKMVFKRQCARFLKERKTAWADNCFTKQYLKGIRLHTWTVNSKRQFLRIRLKPFVKSKSKVKCWTFLAECMKICLNPLSCLISE